MIDWENFYEAIDGIREHEQKSWRDVANWLEMSASTFTRLKQGKSLTAESFFVIADYFNLCVYDFCAGGQQDKQQRIVLSVISEGA